MIGDKTRENFVASLARYAGEVSATQIAHKIARSQEKIYICRYS